MKQEFIKAMRDFFGLVILGYGAYQLLTFVILNL
jgi:hypothetical protein